MFLQFQFVFFINKQPKTLLFHRFSLIFDYPKTGFTVKTQCFCNFNLCFLCFLSFLFFLSFSRASLAAISPPAATLTLLPRRPALGGSARRILLPALRRPFCSLRPNSPQSSPRAFRDPVATSKSLRFPSESVQDPLNKLSEDFIYQLNSH